MIVEFTVDEQHRSVGTYLGSPKAHTYIRDGDHIIAYGESSRLLALERRRNDESGQKEHEAFANSQITAP